MHAWTLEFAAAHHWTLNAKKSQFLCTGNGPRPAAGQDDQHPTVPPPKVNGTPLALVYADEALRYLGVWIRLDGKPDDHIAKLDVQIRRITGLLSYRRLPLDEVVFILNVHMQPKLSFALQHIAVPKEKRSAWNALLRKPVREAA